MIRSYVVTFAFVFFRVFLGVTSVMGVGTEAERLTAAGWFCWSVPLLVTEMALQARRTFAPHRAGVRVYRIVMLNALALLVVLLGVVGTILPGLPGAVFVLIGLVWLAWLDDFMRLGPWMIALLTLLATACYAVDFLATALGAKRAGASQWAIGGAVRRHHRRSLLRTPGNRDWPLCRGRGRRASQSATVGRGGAGGVSAPGSGSWSAPP